VYGPQVGFYGSQRPMKQATRSRWRGSRRCRVGESGAFRRSLGLFRRGTVYTPHPFGKFGIRVAEALAHGLPVLTTTGPPWSILREGGCGWWVDSTVDGIADGLLQATVLDPETLRSMGTKGCALVSIQFGRQHVADLTLSTYKAILARQSSVFNGP
jgi:glycosyltransferase involved in cell wall biosynthesis